MVQNVMALLIVAAAILYLGWAARSWFSGGGGGCGSCSEKKATDENLHGNKRPLISIDPLSEPNEKKPDPPTS